MRRKIMCLIAAVAILFFNIGAGCATTAEEKIRQIEQQIEKQNFAYHMVFGDEKRVTVVLAFDGLAEELSHPYHQAQGANYIPWVKLKASVIDLMDSIKGHMDPDGTLGTDVSLHIVNENDHSEYFLMVMFDQIIEDIMDNRK